MKKDDVTLLEIMLPLITTQIGVIETLKNDVQNDYDNKSEKWQESDAALTAQETIDELQSVCDGLDSAKNSIENIIQNN